MPTSSEGSKRSKSKRKRLVGQLGDFNKRGTNDPFPSAGPTDAPIKLPVIGSTIKCDLMIRNIPDASIRRDCVKIAFLAPRSQSLFGLSDCLFNRLLFGDGVTLRWYDAEVERMATGGIVCKFLSDNECETDLNEAVGSTAEFKKKRKLLASVGSSTMVPWDDIDSRVKLVRQATVSSKKGGTDFSSSSSSGSSSRSSTASSRTGPSYFGWQSQPDAPLVNLLPPKGSGGCGAPRPPPLPRASHAASTTSNAEVSSIRRELARSQARNEKLTVTLADLKAVFTEAKQRHREELSALRTRAQDKRAAMETAEKAAKLQAQLLAAEAENRRLQQKYENLQQKHETLQARIATAETAAKAATRLAEEKARTNAECLAAERHAHTLAHERQWAAVVFANDQNSWLRARIAHFETERSTAAAAEAADDSTLNSHSSSQPLSGYGGGSSSIAISKFVQSAGGTGTQIPPAAPKQQSVAAARAADIAAKLEALGPEPTAPSFAASSTRSTVNGAAPGGYQEPPPVPPVVGPLRTCGICLGFLPGDVGGSASNKNQTSSVSNGGKNRGDVSVDVTLAQALFNSNMNGNRKIVERYDLNTGQVLEEYCSQSACASKLGSNKSIVSATLRREQPVIINGHAIRYKTFADDSSNAGDHRSIRSLVCETKAQKSDTRVRLSCGHCFCGECVQSLSASQVDDVKMGRVTRKAITVQCPFCRQYCREDLTMV